MAKGQNTQDAITELTAMIEDVIGALTNFVLMYAQDRGVIGLPLPPMAFGGPTPATVTTPLMCSTVMTRVDAALHQTRANLQVFKLHYIEPVGYKRIASTNVFST